MIARMTVLDRVRELVARLAPYGTCDDCIASKLQITPRQHANHKTRELEKTRAFVRGVGECAFCKATHKKVIRRA